MRLHSSSNRGRQLADAVSVVTVMPDHKYRKRRRGNGAGPLTGRRCQVVSGPRAGIEGVFEGRYFEHGRYWCRLEDGFCGVLPKTEIEVMP